MLSSANQPRRLLKLPKPLMSTGGAFRSRARSADVTIDRAGAVAPQAAIEQAERRHDQPRLEIVVQRQRLLHLRVGIAQRVLAEGDRDLARTARAWCRRGACAAWRRTRAQPPRRNSRIRDRTPSRSWLSGRVSLLARAPPPSGACATRHRGRSRRRPWSRGRPRSPWRQASPTGSGSRRHCRARSRSAR